MAAPYRIELNLQNLNQLFNSMDPSPFHEKDLDRDADEFIVSWASEHPIDAPITLRIHLETWPGRDPTEMIAKAVGNHFDNRAKLAALEFRRFARDARASLAIGLVFLALCLVIIRFIAGETTAWGGYVAEGLTIAGWVAMWRPMQMYLYDWWPVRRKVRRFARLAEMPVEVVASAGRRPA
jgi:hypothetical protein